MTTPRNLPRVFVAGIALLGLAGCAYDPYYPQSASVYAYHPAPAVVYHDYYYYPGVQVYWHIPTGYYWYYSGYHWVHSRHLPKHIHLHRHESIKLRAPQERPYLKYRKHNQYYHRQTGQHRGERNEHDTRRDNPSVIKAPAARGKASAASQRQTQNGHREAPRNRYDARSGSGRDGQRSERDRRTRESQAQRPTPPEQSGERQRNTIKGNPALYGR